MPDATANTRPIRVTHVIASLDVGGAETMLAGLVSARPAALEQSVISLVPGGALERRVTEAGAPLASLGMRRGRPSIGGLLRLVRLIRAQRPDVLQSWMYHADLAGTLALGLSGRRGTVRHAWNLRCSDMEGIQYGRAFRLVRAAWLALASRADLLIANSAAGLDFHRRLGMRAAKTLVIPNGIDTARFRPDAQARARLRAALGILPERQLVAVVARVDPMKDHAGFLAAMRGLPGAGALLIGRGTERLDVPPGIIRLGERQDVPELLNAADLVVNASAYGEGFSNALAEGMAAGLPAVATDVGDAREILGDTGVLCRPRDPAALAEAIKRLLSENAEQHRRRSEAARRRIVEHFSLEACVQRFVAAYRDMVGRAPISGRSAR